MNNDRLTAEEVLKLHREFREAADNWMATRAEDPTAHNTHLRAAGKWERAYQQWLAERGPVDCEWFIERFGSKNVALRKHVRLKCDHNCVWLTTEMSSHFHNVRIEDPTREQIESLVAMLSDEGAPSA